METSGPVQACTGGLLTFYIFAIESFTVFYYIVQIKEIYIYIYIYIYMGQVIPQRTDI
jgi:hypothetical protein